MHMSRDKVLAMGFPGGTVVKNLAVHAGDTRDVGSIPGSRKDPGIKKNYPPQYSYLENSMDRGACMATVFEVAKAQPQLTD